MTEPTHHYHIALSDEERAMFELQAHNYYTLTGQNMKIPPSLYADLKSGGVDMRHIEEFADFERDGFGDKRS